MQIIQGGGVHDVVSINTAIRVYRNDGIKMCQIYWSYGLSAKFQVCGAYSMLSERRAYVERFKRIFV